MLKKNEFAKNLRCTCGEVKVVCAGVRWGGGAPPPYIPHVLRPPPTTHTTRTARNHSYFSIFRTILLINIYYHAIY